MENKFLSVEELVAYFKISRSKVYELVHTDGFPTLRLGRRILIPVDKLMDWVNENISIN